MVSSLLPAFVFASLSWSSILAASSPARLGHPSQFSVVLEQFPMGLESPDFPLVLLPLEADRTLKLAGLPIVPRGDSPVPPFLHISLVLIKQPYGFVLLAQADLREAVPQPCAGPRSLQVSTWQRRQWNVFREPASLEAAIRKTTDDVLREFIRFYLDDR